MVNRTAFPRRSGRAREEAKDGAAHAIVSRGFSQRPPIEGDGLRLTRNGRASSVWHGGRRLPVVSLSICMLAAYLRPRLAGSDRRPPPLRCLARLPATAAASFFPPAFAMLREAKKPSDRLPLTFQPRRVRGRSSTVAPPSRSRWARPDHATAVLVLPEVSRAMASARIGSAGLAFVALEGRTSTSQTTRRNTTPSKSLQKDDVLVGVIP
jgi:hypothetical protein